MSQTDVLIHYLNKINALVPPHLKTSEYVKYYTGLHKYVKGSASQVAAFEERCRTLEEENIRLAEVIASSDRYYVNLPNVETVEDFGPSIPASVEDLLSPKKPGRKASKKEE